LKRESKKVEQKEREAVLNSFQGFFFWYGFSFSKKRKRLAPIV